MIKIPNNWKEQTQFLNRGKRRNIYIYQNYIIKEVYRKNKSNPTLNQKDFNIYNQITQQIPKEFQSYFGQIYNIQNDILICELIKNYNNTISKNLHQIYPNKIPQEIYTQIEKIIYKLIENNFYYLDIKKENFILKEISKNKFIPIIFDYKNINKTYRFQITTYFKFGKLNKIKRRLKKLKL